MINALSLFSGCGGCSLGLKQAGFTVKLAADIDADACETYAVNLGRETLWPVDLSHVKPEELLGRSGLHPMAAPRCAIGTRYNSRRTVKLLVQPVRLGRPQKYLIEKVRGVTSLQPTWLIMENVEGLLTAEAGYWVKAKKVYMEQYGLPPKRKRVFVLGKLEQCQF